MGEIFTEHHGFLSTAAYFNGRDIYRTPWLLEVFKLKFGSMYYLLILIF
jgi:hypothetical protein